MSLDQVSQTTANSGPSGLFHHPTLSQTKSVLDTLASLASSDWTNELEYVSRLPRILSMRGARNLLSLSLLLSGSSADNKSRISRRQNLCIQITPLLLSPGAPFALTPCKPTPCTRLWFQRFLRPPRNHHILVLPFPLLSNLTYPTPSASPPTPVGGPESSVKIWGMDPSAPFGVIGITHTVHPLHMKMFAFVAY